MLRAFSTLLMLAFLGALALAGCDTLGLPLTETPLAAVPNSIVNHPSDPNIDIPAGTKVVLADGHFITTNGFTTDGFTKGSLSRFVCCDGTLSAGAGESLCGGHGGICASFGMGGGGISISSSGSTTGSASGAIQFFQGRKGAIPLTCDGSVSCSSFACQDEAQSYFTALNQISGKTDCHGLDGDGNGLACDGIRSLPQHCQ